ncbi:hypothetical protein [Actinokineospora sp. NBRC 105648]|uniref:hypothetical protein n=1 Tax=Actinokineospora sp. NBRC 105648 TaxID=3032206 RepID=UPI0024A12C2A|nr:hypothetical protein [Actinokineospora sp. NBRC 105648]GLZ40581.1 hypothetical protein Acsp05_42050 [Actinokineospora sp. NBRC 105648]
MSSSRRKTLVSVLFVVVMLASAKRTANPADPPDPTAEAVIGVLDAPLLWRVAAEALRLRSGR